MSEAGEQTVAPIEQEARSMGWVPKEEFRGDEARWVDAETFVEKGRTMVPLLRHTNRELEQKLATTSGEVARLKGLVEASQEAITALKEYHDEDTKRQVQKAKTALMAELTQAKADGNTALEVQLTDELLELNLASRAAAEAGKAAPPKQEVKPQPAADPDFVAFTSDNPWFGADVRKTNRALGIAQMLRADPTNDALSGRQFYAKVLKEMDMMDPGSHQQVSKVAGSNTSGGSRSGGKGFSDLPPDAKEACAKQAKRLVGTGRAFATNEAWQAHYAEQYFKGE